ncbi:large ribosomal subunit protein bL21m [Parasteatoda tepidariorum]|nr:39S ribosomal protein L21, mitochondrial-like [Parasteatoda tepidariorum]XP_042903891.1 39S ribosomal protein L21, mitochondrial-like [Parasteatoda tepidariorum]
MNTLKVLLCMRNVSKLSINQVVKPSLVQFSTVTSKDNIPEKSNNIQFSKIAKPVNEEVNPVEAEIITKDILSKINTQIKEKAHSRLFAVIQFCENQYKITAEDIISVGSFFPAKVGEKIRLEKVLLVGSTDFTLLGRPLLNKDLVHIEATVIEKTYIVPRPIYRHFKQYRRLHWFRTPYCLIRINSIEFLNTLDSLPDVEGLQNRVIY